MGVRSAHLVAFAFACAAIACQREPIGLDLYGRWISDDPRLAGRVLEIGSTSVLFLDGNQLLDAITVHGVEQDGDAGLSIRYAIEGVSRDGSAVELELELRKRPIEQLLLSTHRAPWRRADDSGRGVPR
jgi:hypothetical protein